ncbi:hypothetical protein OPQ81_000505 [Rhizoctonia solani]|nr:hypothetical protein OPQ81_000505 [Rhizoctonia solani]
MTDMPSPFPQCPHHPPPYTPVTTSRRQGEALTDTPLRPSSSLSTSAPTPKSNPSYVGTSNQNTPATPAPTRQSQMDKYIESELCGAIFHDPRFLERFLSGDRARLDRIHEACQNQDDYYRINGHWKFPSKIRTEKSLYLPVQDILNTIKRAVDKDNTSTHATAPSPSSHGTPSPNSDNSYPPPSDSDLSSDYVPEQPLFVDTSKYTMPSDRAETRWIKPDLVLFEDVGEHRHWEHVRMPVEVKQQPGHQKAAMKQVSRYARAIFATPASSAPPVHFDHLWSRGDICEI